jgi:anti-anti-sigma factor
MTTSDRSPLSVMAAFSGEAAEISVCGDLDLTNAAALDEMLSLVLDKQPRGLALDLGDVEFMDCAAARVIARAAAALPGEYRLTIRRPSLAVRRLIELTGLDAAVVLESHPGHQPDAWQARETSWSARADQPDAALTVTAAREGHVCVLTVTGMLDAVTAGRFAGQAAEVVSAVGGQAERLVLDLAGLSFLDCCGARALAAVPAAAPPGCPVILRSVSPAARRLLGILDLNLERPPQAAAVWDSDEQLVRRARAARAQITAMTSSIHRTEQAIASSADRVATTFDRLAAQHPQDLNRLAALSTAARQLARRRPPNCE